MKQQKKPIKKLKLNLDDLEVISFSTTLGTQIIGAAVATAQATCTSCGAPWSCGSICITDNNENTCQGSC